MVAIAIIAGRMVSPAELVVLERVQKCTKLIRVGSFSIERCVRTTAKEGLIGRLNNIAVALVANDILKIKIYAAACIEWVPTTARLERSSVIASDENITQTLICARIELRATREGQSRR
jgi:hypothetical protein